MVALNLFGKVENRKFKYLKYKKKGAEKGKKEIIAMNDSHELIIQARALTKKFRSLELISFYFRFVVCLWIVILLIWASTSNKM